ADARRALLPLDRDGRATLADRPLVLRPRLRLAPAQRRAAGERARAARRHLHQPPPRRSLRPVGAARAEQASGGLDGGSVAARSARRARFLPSFALPALADATQRRPAARLRAGAARRAAALALPRGRRRAAPVLRRHGVPRAL